MSFETVLAQARAEGRTLLNEVEAKSVLREAGVPVTNTTLATSRDEAQAQAEAAGFPVVLKVVSPDIAHKSDAGGVKLNLREPGRCRRRLRRDHRQLLSSTSPAPTSPASPSSTWRRRAPRSSSA